MAIRQGLTSIVNELRRMADVGTAEYTVAGSAYWSDDDLQKALDRRSVLYHRIPLEPVPDFVNGNTEYRRYELTRPRDLPIEGTASGTVWFRLYSGQGTTITTGYTLSSDDGMIRFDADMMGSVLYVDYTVHNPYLAARDVLYARAVHEVRRFDVRTDAHTLSRSQLAKGYRELGDHYAKLSPPVSTQRRRNDANRTGIVTNSAGRVRNAIGYRRYTITGDYD